MPAGAGQIYVDLLLQTQAFEQKMNETLNQIKQFGTHFTDLNTSVTKTDQALTTTAGKMDKLATSTSTAGQKTSELKPKTDQTAASAEQLGNKVQKTGQDLQAMGDKAEQGGSRLQTLGQRFKDSALAIAGFATSLFNTYMQYDSIKDQEMDLTRRRDRLDRQWDKYKLQIIALNQEQEKFNDNEEESGTTAEELALKRSALSEQFDILTTQEEQYTDAVQDHNNAWKGFALSLAPTIITGLASIQGLMGKFGGGLKTTTTGVTGLAGAGGSLLMKLTPIGIAIGAVSLVLYAIKNNLFGAQDAINKFGVALGNAVPALVPILNGIKSFGIMLGIVPKEFATIERDMTTGMYNIKDSAVPTFAEIGAAVLAFGQNLVTTAQQFTGWIGSVADTLMKGDVEKAFGMVAEASKVAFSNALTFVQGDLLPAITSFITMFGTEIVPKLPELIKVIIDGLVNAWVWTSEVIDKIWQAFEDEVESWFDENKEGFVEKIMEQILKAFGWKEEDIDKFMEDFTKHLKNWVEDPAGELGKLGVAIATKIVEGINFAVEPVLGLFNTYIAPLADQILIEIDKIDWSKSGEAVGTGVVEAITWIGKGLTAAFTGMWDKFVKEAEANLESNKTGNTYTKFGENVGSILLKLITVTPGALGEFATGFWEKVLDAIFGEGTFEMVVNAARLIQGKQPLEKTTTPMPLTKEGEVGGVKTLATTYPQKGWTETTWQEYISDKIPPDVFKQMSGQVAKETSGGAGLWSMATTGLDALDFIFNPNNKARKDIGNYVFDIWQAIGHPAGMLTGAAPTYMTDEESKKTLDQMINAALIPTRGGSMQKSISQNYPAPGGLNYPSLRQNATVTPEMMSLGGAVTGTEMDAFAQAMAQKTTEISAMFLTMKDSIIGTMTALQTFLGGWATNAMGTIGTAISTQTTTVSSYFLTMKEAIIGQMVELQTYLGSYATNVLATWGTAMSVQTTTASSYFLTMKESVILQMVELQTFLGTWATETLGTWLAAILTQLTTASTHYITHETSVKGTLLRIGTALTDFITTNVTKFATDILTHTSKASTHFITMETSVKGTLATRLAGILTDFATKTMKDFGDKTSVQTTAVSASFKVMSENIADYVDDSIKEIDKLIKKLEDLIEKQEEADSDGGGDGGGSDNDESGAYGFYFQHGGRFIVNKPTRIGRNVVGEAGAEMITVTPLKNFPTRIPNIRNAVNYGAAGFNSGNGRGISINGVLNAVLMLPNGRELASTSAPYTLEYMDAGH